MSDISRRDFLNGVALGAGASLLGGALPDRLVAALRAEEAMQAGTIYYPPTLTGMRGSHDGSWETAHQLRDGTFWRNAPAPADTGESYDLVVVGAGISGLAAAYFFRARAGRAVRILLLDNHDDFGGHAKRNEFHQGRRTLLMNGGTLEIDSPTPYSHVADGLLRELGVDPPALAAKFGEHGTSPSASNLRRAIFFDRETFGTDRLVVGVPTGRSADAAAWRAFAARTPLSTDAQRDWIRLELDDATDYMAVMAVVEKRDRL